MPNSAHSLADQVRDHLETEVTMTGVVYKEVLVTAVGGIISGAAAIDIKAIVGHTSIADSVDSLASINVAELGACSLAAQASVNIVAEGRTGCSEPVHERGHGPLLTRDTATTVRGRLRNDYSEPCVDRRKLRTCFISSFNGGSPLQAPG